MAIYIHGKHCIKKIYVYYLIYLQFNYIGLIAIWPLLMSLSTVIFSFGCIMKSHFSECMVNNSFRSINTIKYTHTHTYQHMHKVISGYHADTPPGLIQLINY